MITGRRAFNGGSQLSTLASVLQKDPAPVNEARDQVPREVERIIERCLRKDPRRRWQRTADLKIAIEDALEDFESGKQDAARQVRKSRVGLRPWAWAALILLALAGGALIGGRALRSPEPSFPTPDLPARQRCRGQIRAGWDGALQCSMGDGPNRESSPCSRAEANLVRLIFPMRGFFPSVRPAKWQSCSAVRDETRPERSLVYRYPVERRERFWKTSTMRIGRRTASSLAVSHIVGGRNQNRISHRNGAK